MNTNNSANDTNKFPDPTAANVRTLFKLAQQMVATPDGTAITPDKFVAAFGGEVAGMLNTIGVLLISKQQGNIHNQLANVIKQILFGMPVEIAKQVGFVNALVKDSYLRVTNVSGVVGIEAGVHGTVKEVEISKDLQDNTIIIARAELCCGVKVSRTYKFDPSGTQLPNAAGDSGWEVEQ